MMKRSCANNMNFNPNQQLNKMMNTPKANLSLKNRKVQILKTVNKDSVIKKIKILLKVIKLQTREENLDYNNQ